MAGPFLIAQVTTPPDPTSPSDVLLMALVVCAVGALALIVWVLPVVLGIRAAQQKAVSPHWMWFGLHPLGGWVAWAVLQFAVPARKQCARCGKVAAREANFCGRCGNALLTAARRR